MLFKEIIHVFSKNRKKKEIAELLFVRLESIYCYLWDLMF